jgi:hypothetical protein
VFDLGAVKGRIRGMATARETGGPVPLASWHDVIDCAAEIERLRRLCPHFNATPVDDLDDPDARFRCEACGMLFVFEYGQWFARVVEIPE